MGWIWVMQLIEETSFTPVVDLPLAPVRNLVNVDNITRIAEHGGRAMLALVSGEQVYVRESATDLQAMLKENA